MNYKLRFLGMKGGIKHVDVSNSEEDFRNTTVRELKIKLRRVGLEVEYQNIRLIYTDKLLEDDDTLGDHGITHLDTLCVIIRLPGGGGGIPEDGGVHRTESMEKLSFSM